MGRPPHAKGFRPFGAGSFDGQPIMLFYEEFESIRLCDYEGCSQETAAAKMDVSRPTFTRVYEAARRKIARALTESCPIYIGGGAVEFPDSWYVCRQCSSEFKQTTGDNEDIRCKVCGSDLLDEILVDTQPDKIPAGMNKMPGMHQGHCICPACDKRIEHVAGMPCRLKICENCGVSLVREGSPHHQKIISIKNKNNE